MTDPSPPTILQRITTYDRIPTDLDESELQRIIDEASAVVVGAVRVPVEIDPPAKWNRLGDVGYVGDVYAVFDSTCSRILFSR